MGVDSRRNANRRCPPHENAAEYALMWNQTIRLGCREGACLGLAAKETIREAGERGWGTGTHFPSHLGVCRWGADIFGKPQNTRILFS